MAKVLKPVNAAKNPGLAKLPTEVRNKMGFQKNGGKLKKQAAIAMAMKAAGKKPKKARGGATLAPSKKSTSTSLASYGRPLGKNLSGKLKKGGSVKKAMGGYKMMKMGGRCRGGC
jgi:hypothetical protein